MMPSSLFSIMRTDAERGQFTATSSSANNSHSNTPRKGPHPMRFPQDDEIPTTEEALRAQGVKFCFHKILAQNQCLARAKVR